MNRILASWLSLWLTSAASAALVENPAGCKGCKLWDTVAKKCVDVNVVLKGKQGGSLNCNIPETMVDVCIQAADVEFAVTPAAAVDFVSAKFDVAGVATATVKSKNISTGKMIVEVKAAAGSSTTHFTFLRGRVNNTNCGNVIKVYGKQKQSLKPTLVSNSAYVGAKIIAGNEPARHLFIVRTDASGTASFWAVDPDFNLVGCALLQCGILSPVAENLTDDCVYLFPFTGNVATLNANISGYQCVCYSLCTQNSNTAANTVTGGALPPNRGWCPGDNATNANNPCSCAP
jgi:hypothetical protein